jgi:UDP-N-acetylglucosamine 2-epimerase (non-hydrolysing)
MSNLNSKKVIYVLGTKAQFIKSKQVLLKLYEKNINILILDTGQHKELTTKELKNSGLVYDYISLTDNKENISKVLKMIIWFFKIIMSSRHKEDFQNISYSLIHGDTVSTLIGLIISKRNKIKTIHLESGYKSNNILKPFPEEIVRSIVSKYSDILVVDGEQQYKNVQKYINDKRIIKISRNTIFDSVSEHINKGHTNTLHNQLIVTVHRTENVYIKTKLMALVDLLEEIIDRNYFDRIEWFCHDVTRNMLTKYRLINRLEEKGIVLSDLVSHDLFINELIGSKAVITDGGSIAEECSLLGLNTIIWRDVVENNSYLNDNVMLSKYNNDTIHKFLLNLSSKRKKNIIKESPSGELVDELIQLL